MPTANPFSDRSTTYKPNARMRGRKPSKDYCIEANRPTPQPPNPPSPEQIDEVHEARSSRRLP